MVQILPAIARANSLDARCKTKPVPMTSGARRRKIILYGRGIMVVQQSPKLPYVGSIPTVHAILFALEVFMDTC